MLCAGENNLRVGVSDGRGILGFFWKGERASGKGGGRGTYDAYGDFMEGETALLVLLEYTPPLLENEKGEVPFSSKR